MIWNCKIVRKSARCTDIRVQFDPIIVVTGALKMIFIEFKDLFFWIFIMENRKRSLTPRISRQNAIEDIPGMFYTMKIQIV